MNLQSQTNFVILFPFQIETKAMPDFETVVQHAQDYIEGKAKTPKVINDLEDVTCRFQSCCMVSWNSKSWWKWQKVW